MKAEGNLRFSGRQVTIWRRFLGDYSLETLLVVVTLFGGWLIWFAIVAPRGQTPAKQLLKVYIHSYDSGDVASAGRVWMREIVGKFAIPWFVGLAGVLQTGSPFAFFAGDIFFLIGALTIFFNDDRRALWDYIGGSMVRHHPIGAPSGRDDQLTLATSKAAQRLSYLGSLRTRGLITEEEYQDKRREILADV